MGFVNYIGVALQVMGVIISGLGLWSTWRRFAAPGEGFFAPVVDPVSRAAARVRSGAQQLLRRIARSPVTQVHVSDSASGLDMIGVLGTVLQFGELPRESEAALAVLHERTQRIMNGLSDALNLLRQETIDRRSDVQVVRSEVHAALSHLETSDRRIATGGIRTQALGLFLVALGLVLAAWPTTPSH